MYVDVIWIIKVIFGVCEKINKKKVKIKSIWLNK